MTLKRWLHPELWLGLAVLLGLSLPFAFTDLDLALAGRFFSAGWPFADREPWYFLYHYGTLPGLFLAAGALAALLTGWTQARYAAWRRPAAVIVVAALLGPGLFVNVLGKGYWGRPRPREVAALGGDQAFHRFIQPGTPGRGKSFPAGHPSMGFLVGTLFFLAPPRRRWAWLAGGAAYGALMGVGRMAQGGHFASDVLWSGGLTYLAGALAHHVILPPADSPVWSRAAAAAAPGRRWISWAVGALVLALVAGFFLVATPYYKEWQAELSAPPEVTAVRLTWTPGPENLRIVHARQEPAVRVRAAVQGFGFPKLEWTGELAAETHGATLAAEARLALRGFVTERTGEIEIRVREGLAVCLENPEVRADLRIGDPTVPGRYGDLRARTPRGDIWLRLAPGSEVAGRVALATQRGDVRLTWRDAAAANPLAWDLGTDRGTVLVEAEGTRSAPQPARVRAWSRAGDAVLTARVAPACGLLVEWNEGDGRSGLQANGDWTQNGRTVRGPGPAPEPGLSVVLAAADGDVAVSLTEIGFSAEPGVPVPTPSAPQPTPTAEEPAWMREELIGLPSGAVTPTTR